MWPCAPVSQGVRLMRDDASQEERRGLKTLDARPLNDWKVSATAVDPTVEILIQEAEIQERVRVLGRQIEADYRGKPLTIVAVLTGSLILLADLVRQIGIPHRIALIQASSYRGATTTATTLVINESFAPDVAGRDVLLLDDILDTGATLAALIRHLSDRGTRSVRTAVLLRKIGRQEIPLDPDYCGFTIPNEFVVGYGLDFNDDYRHLPYVGVLKASEAATGHRSLYS